MENAPGILIPGAFFLHFVFFAVDFVFVLIFVVAGRAVVFRLVVVTVIGELEH